MDRTTENRGRPEVIDIVVVAYRNDIFLLEIQARSILLNLDSDRIANIYICVNDDDTYCSLIDLSWWQNLADKVTIIPRSQLGVDISLDGWHSQQLYKLLLANQAKSLWSLCLDTKTWFVKNLDWLLWFDDLGKVNLKSFPTIPVFTSAQTFLENYFQIKNDNVIGPGGVPFMFHTETVKKLCKTVPDFFNFFCTHSKSNINLTEFMLYSVYVKKVYNSFSYLYSEKQHYKFCNIADRQVKDFDHIWKSTEDSRLLTVSIQERAYPHLSDKQFSIWIEYLKSKKLLAADDPITKKLNTLR